MFIKGTLADDIYGNGRMNRHAYEKKVHLVIASCCDDSSGTVNEKQPWD